MKRLFATTIMLAFAASVWAQGQIVVTGSESLEAAPIRDFGVIAELPVSAFSVSSDWLPRSQRLPLADSAENSSRAEMIEASRTEWLINTPTQATLPPTPDFQISQVEIQPAPEPSTVALGGLAIGLIALTRLSNRQQVLKR